MLRTIAPPGRWCIHAYYTLDPWAPDGSDRLLLAGGDLSSGQGEVIVADSEGKVLDRFGSTPLGLSFYHTGLWQSWSPGATHVYYQSGLAESPRVTRRELASGRETSLDGDLEGAPPFGEPALSGLMGLLYAAGYGGGGYRPEMAPVPFQARDRHGLFLLDFENGKSTLALSVAEILERHPHRDRLLAWDRDIQARLGDNEGATLMAYCVRWNRDGSRFLFYFGNHCTDKARGEPRIAYVMTADRALSDVRVALDLCEKSGDHWSWQPDGSTLIGNGPDPGGSGPCIAEVRWDGTGCRRLISHRGGHPSVSPADPDLVVTDGSTRQGGAIYLYSRSENRELSRVPLRKFLGEARLPGRNPSWVCHHPVFNADGSKLTFNMMTTDRACVGVMDLADLLENPNPNSLKI